MDLSPFDIPNAYGLRASDFGEDMDSYRVALGCLGDVATGSAPDEALAANGGTPGLARSWEGSQKFRRVFASARQAGAAEREHQARRQAGDPFRRPGRNRLDTQYDPWRVG